jgi:hypothetical protein
MVLKMVFRLKAPYLLEWRLENVRHIGEPGLMPGGEAENRGHDRNTSERKPTTDATH